MHEEERLNVKLPPDVSERIVKDKNRPSCGHRLKNALSAPGPAGSR